MADIFDVLADSTRRDLLSALRESSSAPRVGEPNAGELSVGELVELLGLSQPTVSKHLRVLRDHHLVQVREVGQHRLYRLDSAPLEAMQGFLGPFLDAPDTAQPATAAATPAASGEGPTDDASFGDGTPVFAAFTAPSIPSPVRRIAQSLQNSAATGHALGRYLGGGHDGIRSTLNRLALVLTRRSL
ncbi:MAG: winged helix-turn-helix transcriptional regulator [Microbacteriaceae bacterium]|nr:winged helix-turn-helix transcriptional regulator [Microbacteriaceae bacterium]